MHGCVLHQIVRYGLELYFQTFSDLCFISIYIDFALLCFGKIGGGL